MEVRLYDGCVVEVQLEVRVQDGHEGILWICSCGWGGNEDRGGVRCRVEGAAAAGYRKWTCSLR